MSKLIFKFSQDWNNKLLCDFFTTIRLIQPVHMAGAVAEVQVLCGTNNYVRLKDVVIKHVQPVTLAQLHAIDAWQDTGYNLEATRGMLYNMYKNKVDNPNKAQFARLGLLTIAGTENMDLAVGLAHNTLKVIEAAIAQRNGA
jgi:hypothetical protein